METDRKPSSTGRGSLESCFRELAGSGQPLALATVVQTANSTSGKTGARALVSADGIVEGWIGGGCAQPAVIEAARAVIAAGEARLIRVGPKGEWEALQGVADFSSGCLSGGTQVIFVEPLLAPATLGIFGDSPVAFELGSLAARVDFAVTMASPGLDCQDLPGGIRGATAFETTGFDFIIIATQGRNDRPALKAALAGQAGYIGMVASRRKIAALKASLAKGGVDADRLDRIHSPVGVDIGAVTPAEIALSILAELVRERRRDKAVSAVSNAAAPAVPVTIPDVDEGNGCCGGHG